MSQTNEMVKLAITALEDKKGEDIRVIDIHEVSVLADYFLIASGSNGNQVQAMADNVEEELGKAGYPCKQVEGYQSANWILMDYGDIIVHVFDKESRLFYDIERVWSSQKHDLMFYKLSRTSVSNRISVIYARLRTRQSETTTAFSFYILNIGLENAVFYSFYIVNIW